MKKLFENWRKHVNEATNISAKFSDVDLSQMSSRDLYRLDGDVAAALGGLGIDITDPDADFKSTPEVDELMKQRRDIKIAIRDSERASGARIKGHLEEAEYEPGRAVADIDTGEDYIEPEMVEKEAMEDLADKFNVQVMFAKTTDGKHIAVVTLENGETMGYMDEEEMYQDLARRQEMNEELRDYTGGQSRSPDLQIPGYGIMTVEQVERKLARMLQEAAEDAMKDPPQYSHLNNGVIQALHKALKDFKEL